MSALPRDPREVMREEPTIRRQILDVVAASPLTVPEIAAAISAPTRETLFWVMAMRRYGYLREVKGSATDGYFRYEPAGRDAS